MFAQEGREQMRGMFPCSHDTTPRAHKQTQQTPKGLFLLDWQLPVRFSLQYRPDCTAKGGVQES